MGVLDSILVTPSNHRGHHGQNDYRIDKNYGGILVPWDRLFGTFADERDDEKIYMASASRCTASARPAATCTTTPTCGRCPVWQRAGAPSWVSGWRHWAAGPTNPSNISSPAPLPALMCKTPRRAALVRGAAVRGAGVFVSHFIGVAKGLDRGTAAVYALGILVTAVARGRCSSVLSGASG
ncbi:MAG: sterol desaturase family protein [Haliea sp.]|nr:sterol desaturase family protein [Haliea sp.]